MLKNSVSLYETSAICLKVVETDFHRNFFKISSVVKSYTEAIKKQTYRLVIFHLFNSLWAFQRTPSWQYIQHCMVAIKYRSMWPNEFIFSLHLETKAIFRLRTSTTSSSIYCFYCFYVQNVIFFHWILVFAPKNVLSVSWSAVKVRTKTFLLSNWVCWRYNQRPHVRRQQKIVVSILEFVFKSKLLQDFISW